ncbi:MAG: glycoside hydrolase family 2 TIM barrel-domain containing protein [Luteolibacter sp.]|uniref:glycoside hydrolase family 2 TIM barrel-domain containing protein n=1 Tax=Luteolibacter sp. TaxID=1962973 RepID=UPI003263A0C1
MFSALYAAAPLPPEIENAETLGINKQPWHATLMPYADLKEAITANRYASSLARSLNGKWKFHYVPRPEERPVDFYKPGYDVSKWDEIQVPSCWQVLGYGTPYYRNIGYTFKNDWPRVMGEPSKEYTSYTERNPVGSYVKTFEIPADWKGRGVHVNFDGVDSAFFLWVNGEKVGYSSNSRNVAEFDITPYIKPGGSNTIAAEVYRYNAGSYLEDQDMWRLSGIFRNVTLWSPPELRVRDFTIVTDLDENYQNAVLKVSAKVLNSGAARSPASELSVLLFDAAGKAVPAAKGSVPVGALAPGEETTVSVSIPVSNPAKWTAEIPYLHTAVIGLTGSSPVSARVGFREVEIKGRLFTINGVPVKLKGANRHENWPDTGHTVTKERMIRDIELLKQANCNHVRTCHYSNDPQWYELCDEYGIYLVAEANEECHGAQVLSSIPMYEKAFVDRSVANVENFKNHPSVVIWSLGNESGKGPNLHAALKAVKSLDPTRPTHYEGFGTGDQNPADIDSRMYASIEDTRQAGLSKTMTKPFYQCEYAHAMFNSMGSVGEYNDVFDEYPALMGGAIWEWEDQGIWNRRDPKHPFIAYGGGFGEFPNDGYFIHKGVVFSDRSPKPHYPELKRAYQWIGFAAEDAAAGKFKIRNKYAFTSLGKFAGKWTITEDGKPVKSGVLELPDLAPGSEKSITLPISTIKRTPGAIYHLDLAVSLVKDESWAKAGYEIANGQFEIPNSQPGPVANSVGMKPLVVAKNARGFTIEGEGFSASFDNGTGTLSGLSGEGSNVLLPGGGPVLQLSRAQHQKDDIWASDVWHQLGLDALKTEVLSLSFVQVDPATVRVSSSTRLTGKREFKVSHTASFTILGDGSITVDNTVSTSDPEVNLARMGVRMLLDKRLDQIDYLARGPMENYSDRKRGSDIGRYTSSVADQLTPYAKPMECGNHEDMRWIALKGKGLPTLLVQAAGDPMQFSALPYADEDLEPVPYSVDLPKSNKSVLCLSSKTLGVGSAGCGPRPDPPYRVNAGPSVFSYVLRILPQEEPHIAEIARTRPPQGRPHPVLAVRDAEGKVNLTANGDKVEYSMDGTQWKLFTTPAIVVKPTTLHVRSTAGNGGSFTGQLEFPAYVDRKSWKITASSFQSGDGDPDHAIDSSISTFWHSQYNPPTPGPHFVIIDLGRTTSIKAITHLAREDGTNGRVKHYEIFLSMFGETWGKPALQGELPNEYGRQTLSLPKSESARFVKFVVVDGYSREEFACIADLNIIPAE